MNIFAENLFGEVPKVSSGNLVVEGELDTRHGPILYLEDVSVSFDGFKALNHFFGRTKGYVNKFAILFHGHAIGIGQKFAGLNAKHNILGFGVVFMNIVGIVSRH